MSGAVSAAATMSNSIAITVTLGQSGNFIGFTQSSFGSVSPASVKGSAITSVYTNTGTGQFNITLSAPGAPKSYFPSLLVQKTDGTWVQLNTADATYSTSGANSWTWSSASLWTSTTPSPRSVIVSL